MKRLIATAIFLSVTLVAPSLFVGMSSTALAAGTLTVDQPNNNDRYIAGMSYLIEWTPGNAGATVKIELLKVGKRTKWITKKTANDGEYIWKIPKSVKKNSKYKIKITSTKNSSIYDLSDDTFTILRASNWWKENFNLKVGGLYSILFTGFEDDGAGTWSEFSIHGRNPNNSRHFKVVTAKTGHPVRRGKESYRFEIRPGDCGGAPGDSDCTTNRERSELGVEPKDKAGKEYWYAWSVYFKNYVNIHPANATHGQWKQYMTKPWWNPWDKKWETQSHDVIRFNVQSDGLKANLSKDFANEKYYLVIPSRELSNRWHDFVLNIKWSAGAKGLIRIWRNGKLLVTHKGKNSDTKDPLSFRFGIYRSYLNNVSSAKGQIVYYDELVRGSSCEDVSQFMTCPGGGSLKVTSPNGKEKWKTKKKYTLKWKKGKAGTYVKIQLLKKGKLYKTIAAKTKNDGKHAWRVPSTLVKSAAYKVKITSTKNKKLTDSSDKNFTITK